VRAPGAGGNPDVRLRHRQLSDRIPTRRDLVVFGGYLLAAGLYIAIGLISVDFLLSFWTAFAYVLVVAWLVPLAVRRIL
jgi:hypothetical protein